MRQVLAVAGLKLSMVLRTKSQPPETLNDPIEVKGIRTQKLKFYSSRVKKMQNGSPIGKNKFPVEAPEHQ